MLRLYPVNHIVVQLINPVALIKAILNETVKDRRENPAPWWDAAVEARFIASLKPSKTICG